MARAEMRSHVSCISAQKKKKHARNFPFRVSPAPFRHWNSFHWPNHVILGSVGEEGMTWQKWTWTWRMSKQGTCSWFGAELFYLREISTAFICVTLSSTAQSYVLSFSFCVSLNANGIMLQSNLFAQPKNNVNIVGSFCFFFNYFVFVRSDVPRVLDLTLFI